MPGQCGLDARHIRGREPLLERHEQRVVDVGGRLKDLDPDQSSLVIDVGPYKRVDQFDSAADRSLTQDDVGCVRLSARRT